MDSTEQINILERQLNSLREEPIQNKKESKASIWLRLDDSLARMSPEQIAYINNHQESIQLKQELNSLFIDWLFEKNKNTFVEIPVFEEKAQEYVDSLCSAAQEFSSKRAMLEQENEQLKARLAQLEQKEPIQETTERVLI